VRDAAGPSALSSVAAVKATPSDVPAVTVVGAISWLNAREKTSVLP
jgi:hypothetical protein